MKKYKVIVGFIDRDTLKHYAAGDEFPCDDETRVKELQFKGKLGDEIAGKPAKAKKDPEKEEAKPTTAKKASASKRSTTTKKKA